MASAPPGSGQDEASLDGCSPYQGDQQPADLGERERDTLRPTARQQPDSPRPGRGSRWLSARSRPGSAQPASSSGSATPACGRRSLTESSGSAVHRSAPPASSVSRSKSPRRDWWMRSRSSAGASGSCSSPCGWRRYRATGSSSNSSTNPQPGQLPTGGASPPIASPVIHSPTAQGLAPAGAGRYRPDHDIRPSPPTGPGRLAGPAAGRASHDLRRRGVRRRPGRGRLARLAQDDQAALDQACDVCLSYTDLDLGSAAGRLGSSPGSCTDELACPLIPPPSRESTGVSWPTLTAGNRTVKDGRHPHPSAPRPRHRSWPSACRSASSCSAASAWRSSQARPGSW